MFPPPHTHIHTELKETFQINNITFTTQDLRFVDTYQTYIDH
jgi:hypothetical protein